METLDVAVIGLSLRFPGANDANTYWNNLRNGICTLTRFSVAELVEAGVDRTLAESSNYVPVGGVLDCADQFDTTFFGMTAAEAALTDPQHRLFLTCAAEALENGGYNPALYGGRIGCFGGAGMSLYAGPQMDSYLSKLVVPNAAVLKDIEGPQVIIANRNDYLCTRVSYKLGLTGPSINIQSACSTGLVAVHVACQAVLNGECDMALAGAASISIPLKKGYCYSEGSMLAPDGVCRPFDAAAAGTVGGSGVAVILLKRLVDAQADNDVIHAVIKGTAVNNDGNTKVSFTAPSVRAQANVVAEAQEIAGVPADSIGFIEAHGTGTKIGDPIEIAALTEAFQRSSSKTQFCALGSVKANIGHLDAAAGMAGLIKVILSLQHGLVPPALNFERSNPAINFQASPFFVNPALIEWPVIGGLRRAGVSALGAGGTNAHIILEQAPPRPLRNQADETSANILTISAKTTIALSATVKRWQVFLQQNDAENFADICTSSSAFKPHYTHRIAIAATDASAAQKQLARKKFLPMPQAECDGIAFLFTGQGAQGLGMARTLLAQEPIFREAIAACDKIVGGDLKVSLYNLLSEPDTRIHETRFTQPAMFAFAYGLSQMWAAWGLKPAAVFGHSLGEYAAAVVAGIMTLPEALRLVIARARLMNELPVGGAMAAVLGDSKKVLEKLIDYPEVSLAALNGPENTVVSGEKVALKRFLDNLPEGIEAQLLNTSHAFHSALLEPMLAEFRTYIERTSLHSPIIPLISSLTGEIASQAITSSSYWVRQAREPVQFQKGIESLWQSGLRIFIELGPKSTLLNMARSCVPAQEGLWLPSMMGDHDSNGPQEALARLYENGATIDWQSVTSGRGHRITVPSYAFEPQIHWLMPPQDKAASITKSQQGYNRLAIEWVLTKAKELPADKQKNWVIVADEITNAKNLATRLIGKTKIFSVQDLDATALRSMCEQADCVIYLAPSDEDLELTPQYDVLGGAAWSTLYQVSTLIQSILAADSPTDLILVTYEACGVGQLGPRSLSQSAIWGMARSLRLEHPELALRCIDVDYQGSNELATEIAVGTDDEVALRVGGRYIPKLTTEVLQSNAFIVRENATYLITGGLGGLGLLLAEWLIAKGARNICLVSRTIKPDIQHQIDVLRRKDVRIEIELTDVSNAHDLSQMLVRLRAKMPKIRGIFHAAGIVSDRGFLKQSAKTFDEVIAAKAAGAWNLHLAIDEPLDYFICFSSIASVFGSMGQANYAAANAFVDALTTARRRIFGLPGLSVSWGPWAQIGMAQSAKPYNHQRNTTLLKSFLPGDGGQLFTENFGLDCAHVCIFASNKPIDKLLNISPISAARMIWDVPEPVLSIKISTSQLLNLADIIRQSVSKVAGILVEQVDDKRPFQEMGLDSMLMLQLRNLLSTQIKCPLAIMLLYRHPTVEELTAELSSHTPPTLALDNAQVEAKDKALPDDLEDAIAVVGMACRFPQADTPEALWDTLISSTDTVAPIPSTRWQAEEQSNLDFSEGKEAALLDSDSIANFDPAFFSISPREAEAMDPQHRLLLELAWEALERAGIAPGSLSGTPTGVFIGLGSDDYQYLTLHNTADLDQYSGTGISRSMAVGRIAYLLGLDGPAIQIDTSCSSSLVAVHQACQALRLGECDLVLCGGAHLLLSRLSMRTRIKLTALSPDGRSKTFDAAANGFGLGEGAGMVVLKRLKDAKRDGLQVLAILRGSAVNHNGRSNGITAPSESAQERLIQRALHQAKINPAEVGHIEAHGTGTALGDPIELAALGRVFGKDRPLTAPLLITSAKTNFGHLEAAAGILSLIKVVLTLQHGVVPPHLHFHTPNPHVPWAKLPFSIPTTAISWPVALSRRIAGVGSFGMNGTNAYVFLEAESLVGELKKAPEGKQILLLSGRSLVALCALAGRYAAHLKMMPHLCLEDICFTAAVGRNHYSQRCAILFVGRADLCHKLSELSQNLVPEDCLQKSLSQPNNAPMTLSFERPCSGFQEIYEIAAAYVNGQLSVWPFERGRLTQLPTYPFERKRFWKPQLGEYSE